ncbi:MAG TPA: Asd/ArgC dimerization domain-containing protein [Bryobacteraceae bacterium]|nr:Asd/ArgC dimerization domain-containing protein [Bryobacteraceae bacterium]
MDLVALIGSETPLGREVRDVLNEAGLGKAVRLIGSSDTESVLAQDEGELTVLSQLDETELADADVIVNAAAGGVAAKAHAMTPSTPLIDLTGELEGQPSARIRCPILENGTAAAGNPLIVAHSAATALALLLRRIQKSFPIAHAVAQVFEPVSERGASGIHELQSQVTSLLSFKPLTKDIFDAQVAFNLLPAYGEEAQSRLGDSQDRLERHLATVLAGQTPMPSVRLIHAPVFHGHAGSLWIEFETRPGVVELEQALATAQIDVRSEGTEPASNVGIAGISGVVAGPVESDPHHPRACWIWFAADNYRLAADSAVTLVRAILQGDDA